MSEELKDYFTTGEAAKLLGVAVSTIQLWANNGLLRAWTTGGGHRRIACSSVEEFLFQQKEVSGDLHSSEQMSFVIVEDDIQLLRLYEKQCLGWNKGIKILLASDGYDGLVKIGNILPDVIITDLNMPNFDGFQMIRALNKISALSHSLFIVITGLTSEEIKVRGGLPEGIHIFTKPVLFDEVKLLLKQKLSSMRAQNHNIDLKRLKRIPDDDVSLA